MSTWHAVADALRAAPNLEGAACTQHSELFDSTTSGDTGIRGQAPVTAATRAARLAAVRVCEGCPALSPCRAWLDALPISRRPSGVVAGRIVTASGRYAAASHVARST